MVEEVIHLKNGVRIEIWQDQDSESPREWGNDSQFYTWHRRYMSPDTHGIREPMYDLPKDCIGIKVWMYDHSGHCYKAADENPFHCPWDSGQVGWIFMTKAQIRARLRVKYVTKAVARRAIDQMIHEVDLYSEWVNGEVYGYTTYDAAGEEVDSCGGYYGSDREYMLECAKESFANAV